MVDWNKDRFIEEDGFDKPPEEMCRRINKFLVIRKIMNELAQSAWGVMKKLVEICTI